MSKKDIIAQLWNRSMCDYDHTSANLERFYDASRADLEQRLSEAEKVITEANDGLLYAFDICGIDTPPVKDALETIEAYQAANS